MYICVEIKQKENEMKVVEYWSENHYRVFRNRNNRLMCVHSINSLYFSISPMDKLWQAKKYDRSIYELKEIEKPIG